MEQFLSILWWLDNVLKLTFYPCLAVSVVKRIAFIDSNFPLNDINDGRKYQLVGL